MKTLSTVLLASFLTALSASAFAADPPADTRAHVQLADTHAAGELARYIVGPSGHVRGFTLKDGTVVLVRPRLGDALADQVTVGQTVRVDGRSTANEPKVVFRAAVYGPHGQIAAPAAGGEKHGRMSKEERANMRAQRREALAKLPAASADGTVQAVISGRHGAPRTLLLSNGASVFLDRSLVQALGGRSIRVGDAVKVSGKGGTYKNGASVAANELVMGDGTRFAGEVR
jgi:hypothetical protein